MSTINHKVWRLSCLSDEKKKDLREKLVKSASLDILPSRLSLIAKGVEDSPSIPISRYGSVSISVCPHEWLCLKRAENETKVFTHDHF